MPSRTSRATLAVMAGAAVLAAAAPVAGAAPADPRDCVGQGFAQQFLAHGDSGWYTAVPGASFESDLAGWDLDGAYRVDDPVDNRPSDGVADARALELPAGAVATSAPMCVTDAHRSLRFFARASPGPVRTRGAVWIEVLATDARGLPRTQLVRDHTPGTEWGPTDLLRLRTAIYGTSPQSPTATVRFRFSARNATVRIDDVFVDPRMK